MTAEAISLIDFSIEISTSSYSSAPLSLLLIFRHLLQSTFPFHLFPHHSRSSFLNLTRWLTDCRSLASPHLVVVLVGSKKDKEEEREVGYLEASRWAGEHSEFRTTSCLSDFRIRALRGISELDPHFKQCIIPSIPQI